MKLVRHIRDLPHADLKAGSVVTIGNFDGFHCGHRKLLDRVILKSHSMRMLSIVMSFEPTPKEYFSSANPPARLMRFREKYDFLESQGIDIFYCPQFSPAMQNIRSIDFIRQVLVQGMNARHIIVGDDFHFARKREGSIEDLLQTQKLLGFTIEKIDSIFYEGIRVSSTVIRTALASGNLNLATSLLGRSYRMSGRVVKGRQIGRTLGYPTANVALRRRQSAIRGIFAVKVSGLKEGIIFGVASVGTRPTFDLKKPILEIHLLDFNRDIYGEYIHVDFIAHIRDELRFESEGDLVKAMNKDAENARSIFSVEKGK
ncbi:MAG: bifunctional riboflavin kinase/FMN adenylyltransferase [Gammaproteobacteria bacterium]|nr:bifunctional riboflavin kinase/FMN adenylyltransferase [Gammaproteobacteria bacterium]